MNEKLLEIKNLKVHFNRRSNIFSKGNTGTVKAVDEVNITVNRNEIHGLVGESGSGKSSIAKAVMGLVPITDGSIKFKGKKIDSKNINKDRTKIQMVFQDPNSSLNPGMKVKEILSEPIIINNIMPKREIKDYLEELMEKVDLPVEFLNRYPHQLSGGQRQRIGIARALTTKPELIVADEPTSALDVSVQSQLLNLLIDLKNNEGLSILIISHNLAVIKYVSDNISVMRNGELVETGTPDKIFNQPEHEYTEKLIDAIPHIKQFK